MQPEITTTIYQEILEIMYKTENKTVLEYSQVKSSDSYRRKVRTVQDMQN